jgi:hypothetical protein
MERDTTPFSGVREFIFVLSIFFGVALKGVFKVQI